MAIFTEVLILRLIRFVLISLVFLLILTACSPEQAVITSMPQLTATTVTAVTPEWFDMELNDAYTGETFTINDYAGKVILLETMAIWCPNCIIQGNEVSNLHEALGNPDDLISISLDVDFYEDQASLKEYVSEFGFDWHFAIAPILVARALGNLYSAEYLNPPLSPMLIIDRDGSVHQLEYGIKDAETLQKIVEPYLAK
jgi:thiol-disulfide isomerase/thioredoxin